MSYLLLSYAGILFTLLPPLTIPTKYLEPEGARIVVLPEPEVESASAGVLDFPPTFSPVIIDTVKGQEFD
jgi:hypothetical protein